jgi:hypothetical protein
MKIDQYAHALENNHGLLDHCCPGAGGHFVFTSRTFAQG